MPSMKEYSGLFRDTLEVSNVTFDMLVDGLRPFKGDFVEEEDDFEYTKDLLQEIALLRPSEEELQKLDAEPCWPCRTPEGLYKLDYWGACFFNDRQNLFNVFADSHTFLDFDFDTSRKLEDLFRNHECDMFLSKQVSIEMEPCEPLIRNDDLTRDFRSRAKALKK
jgi:hypothetical protein